MSEEVKMIYKLLERILPVESFLFEENESINLNTPVQSVREKIARRVTVHSIGLRGP